MPVSYHALYSDGRSYEVIYDPAQRRTYLATADTPDGRMPVPFYVDSAEFVDFEFRGFPGMLPSAAWAERAKMDQLLTRPVKPSEAPRVQHEDQRLHIEPKQPGQSSLAQLQTAAARAEAEARTNRSRQRQQIQNVLNLGDPRKTAEARQINNEFAAIKRPRS